MSNLLCTSHKFGNIVYRIPIPDARSMSLPSTKEQTVHAEQALGMLMRMPEVELVYTSTSTMTSLRHHAQPSVATGGSLRLEIHVVSGGGGGGGRGGLKTLTGVASSAGMLLETLQTTSNPPQAGEQALLSFDVPNENIVALELSQA